MFKFIVDVYDKLFINNNFSFESFINKIKSFIDDNSLNNEALKYRLDGKGCVAFAYKKIDNWYFSLSGSSVDYIGSTPITITEWGKIQMTQWKKIQMTHTNRSSWTMENELIDAYNAIYEALCKYIEGKYRVKNPRITDCHLTDITRRYVLYDDIFLSSSVTLENEVKHNGIEGLNQHYSCCERKILTYIGGGFVNPDYLKPKPSANNILTNYTFIIRYDPCKKCMPALFGCVNIITGKGNRSIVKNNNVFECKP